MIGSDSPSNRAALVNWSREELRWCMVRAGRMVDMFGTLGLFKVCMM
jgi:hypothetical protein